MHPITRIILHCTASRAGVDLTANDIRSYHCNPATKGCRGGHNSGYHYIIRLYGRIEQLPVPQYVANGVKGYNAQGIHVCYVGGLDMLGPPANTLTPAQYAALATLVAERMKR